MSEPRQARNVGVCLDGVMSSSPYAYQILGDWQPEMAIIYVNLDEVDFEDDALLLGQTTPLEMMEALSPIANDGRHASSWFIAIFDNGFFFEVASTWLNGSS